MTDASLATSGAPARKGKSLVVPDARTKRRNAAEARFKAYGVAAIGAGIFFLVVLLSAILINGVGAFQQTFIQVPVYLDPAKLDKSGNRDPEEMKKVSTFGYSPLIQDALFAEVQAQGVDTPLDSAKAMKEMISASAAAQVRDVVLADPDLVGETVDFQILASSRVDGYLKGRVQRADVARDKNINVEHLDLTDALREKGIVARRFNMDFITGADASESRAEQAGLGVSILGSLFMMLVVLLLSLPIGVAASIYLEEFAKKNRFTDIIEVNISNLAAVPSIVFGILGLAVFIQFMHLPQSAPLVGGLVLTLMT
uniref:DUF3333 domain-containing protein n=1 Tax=Puniceibacterium confluentis TaxID=1958944 RepID=UPI0035689672